MAIPLLVQLMIAGGALGVQKTGQVRARGARQSRADGVGQAALELAADVADQERQQAIRTLVNTGNQDAAFELANKTIASELQQFNTERDFGLAAADSDRQFGQYLQGVRASDVAERNATTSEGRLQWDQGQAERELQLVATQRAQHQADLTDPEGANSRALRDGKSTFTVRDQLSGSDTLVPVTGSADWRAGVDEARTITDGLTALQEMTALVNSVGPRVLPSDAFRGELQAKFGRQIFALKEITKAGALDSGLIDALELLIKDPTSWTSQAAIGKDALVSQLVETQDFYGDIAKNAALNIRNHQGVEPELGAQMQQNQMLLRDWKNVRQGIQQSQAGRPTTPGDVAGAVLEKALANPAATLGGIASVGAGLMLPGMLGRLAAGAIR